MSHAANNDSQPDGALPALDSGGLFSCWDKRPSAECANCKSTDMDYQLSSHPFLCLKCMSGEGKQENGAGEPQPPKN